MSKFVSIILISLTFISLFGTNNFGQSEEKYLPKFSVFNLMRNGKSVVYAKETDNLPNKINAKGIIVDASVSGKYCGTTATGGTLKIKLSKKLKNYKDDYLYVIALCLAGEENENLVGKVIEIEVKKMTKFPYSFGVLLSNGIDSNGTPFYLSTVDGVGGILEKLQNKTSKKVKRTKSNH
jgi:hypothetical protein